MCQRKFDYMLLVSSRIKLWRKNLTKDSTHREYEDDKKIVKLVVELVTGNVRKYSRDRCNADELACTRLLSNCRRAFWHWPPFFLPFGAPKSTLVKGIGEVRCLAWCGGGYLAAAPRLCTVDVHRKGRDRERARSHWTLTRVAQLLLPFAHPGARRRETA